MLLCLQFVHMCIVLVRGLCGPCTKELGSNCENSFRFTTEQSLLSPCSSLQFWRKKSTHKKSIVTCGHEMKHNCNLKGLETPVVNTGGFCRDATQVRWHGLYICAEGLNRREVSWPSPPWLVWTAPAVSPLKKIRFKSVEIKNLKLNVCGSLVNA